MSSLSRRSYCTPLDLTNLVVYSVLNATSHLFGQGYLYLTDAQIIRKVLVGPVHRHLLSKVCHVLVREI